MNHLDVEMVSSLKMVMEDEFSVLVDAFLNDSTERIRVLHELLRQAQLDGDAIRRAAHSFKGSSSNMGALELSSLCGALEQKAHDNTLVNLPEDLARIEREFAQVTRALNLLR